MKTKWLKIGILPLLALSTLSFVLATSNKEEPVEVEAASHPGNYANYTYSGNYYSSVANKTGEGMSGSLRVALTSLIHPGSVPSYSGSGATHLSTVLQYADEDPENSSNMIYLYTRNSVTKNAASSWNREHVWPQSLSNNCWGTGRAGTDLLHLRPTYNTTNSTRGNLKYGNVSGGTTRVYNSITYGYTSGSLFMPLDSVKGDVARIIMYVWTAYYDEYGSKLPAITNVFESFNTLMEWHISDRPDVMEGNRNDYAENSSMQKNRNPFVDHPEYAWKIFGSNCSASVLNAAKAAYPEGEILNYCTISNTSKSLKVDDTASLTATSSDNSQITWSTSDSSIVSISNTTSASGSGITITAKAEGTATIYAQATIGGKQYKSNCVVTVTTDGSSGGDTPTPVDATTLTLYPSDFGTYTNGVQKDGFASVQAGQYNNSVQFKKNEGRLYNTAALTNINSIVINKTSGKSNNITVYGSTTSNTTTTKITPTESGNTYTYNFSSYDYPYFIMVNGSGATNLDSIVISYGSSSSGGEETKTLESIYVLDPKTTFNVGDAFAFNGTVTAEYSDDDTADITDYATFSGYNMNNTGNQTVTVSYTEGDVTRTTTYQITVNALVLSSIAVSNQKTSYYVGDAFVKPTVTATFNNASTDATIANSCTYSGYNMSEAGNYTVTVSYTTGGVTKTTSYQIVVNAVTLTSISVTGQEIEYYVGDAFVKPTVTANFNNGQNSVVTSSATFSGFNSTSAATGQTITVSYTYGGHTETTSYTVDILAIELENIEISNYKTRYTLNETFSFDGICNAEYNNGDSRDVTPTSVTSPNMSTEGTKTITVSYTEGGITKTATYDILVSSQSGHTYDVPVEAGGYYEKVTTDSVPTGKYLIVYESTSVALNGGINSSSYDVTNNNISVTIEEGRIESNDDTEAACFTWNAASGTLVSAAGYYIGRTSNSTGMNASSTNVLTNSISIDDDGNAIITASNGYVLRYNHNSGQYRFRYYNGASVSAIQLYKFVSASSETEEKEITSITVTSTQSTYHPGEILDTSKITVTANYDGGSFNPTQDILYSLGSNYMFTYEDSGTGTSTKTLYVTFANWTEPVVLTVSREARTQEGTSTVVFASTEFADQGIGTSSTTKDVTINKISLHVNQCYMHNTNLSFSESKTYSSGYVKNNVAGNPITNVTTNNYYVPVYLSVNGTNWVTISEKDENTDYYYFLVGYQTTTSVGYYENISNITVTYKTDSAVSLSNYVMYEDTPNQCTGDSGKFNTAAAIFNSLSDTEKDTFLTSNSYVISTARERLEAWARHEGKSFQTVDGEIVLAAIKHYHLFEMSDNNITLLIVSISAVTSLCFVIYMVLKKKKETSK